MGSTINQYNSKPTKNNELNKELDKFKNRIDSLMKVIEDFEVNYINSSESKRIKDELNDLINSKNYFSTYECHSSQKSMKLHKRQIYFRESNKNIFNKVKNNNTSIISSKNGRNKNSTVLGGGTREGILLVAHAAVGVGLCFRFVGLVGNELIVPKLPSK